jgi:hypothetical protein
MLGKMQSVAFVALCASATATANAQELLQRPGQTVALGVIGASVYYDETGGDFRLVATIAEPLGGIPIRLDGQTGERGAADPHAKRPRYFLPRPSH